MFTFALDATTGVWTFTLLDQIDHALTDDPSTTGTVETAFEDDLTILLGSLIQATDKDGDTVSAFSGTSVQVLVDDDTPVVVSATVSSGTVDEDGIIEDATPGIQQGDGIAGGPGDVAGTATVATGTIAGLVQFQSGADEGLTFSLSGTSGLPELTSGGNTVFYQVVGNLLTASTDSTFVDADQTVFTFSLSGEGCVDVYAARPD